MGWRTRASQSDLRVALLESRRSNEGFTHTWISGLCRCPPTAAPAVVCLSVVTVIGPFFLCLNAAQGGVSLINGALWEGERGSLGTQRHTNMSGAPTVSTNPQTAKMKKDESFLGKLGGTLVRKKKSKEGGPFEVLFFLFLFYMMEDPHFSFSCSCFCPWCCSLRYGNILPWASLAADSLTVRMTSNKRCSVLLYPDSCFLFPLFIVASW